MRILQLCKKFPFPLKDGESIAVTNLSKALHKSGCELVLLSMNTSKHYVDISRYKEGLSQYEEVHSIEIDNQVKPFKAFLNLFTSKSYHVTRFQSDAFSKKLKEILKAGTFDIILLETAFLAPYIPVIRKHSKASVIMRAHNVEHEIWERIASNTRFVPLKWYLKHSAQKLKRFELNVLNSYDFLVPISEVDLEKYRELGYANGAEAIPIGLDFDHYTPSPISLHSSLHMSFIGSLDWLPNYEGLVWFVKEIFPKIHKKFPDLQLHIAGRNRPEKVNLLKDESISIHGEVEDAKDFLNAYPIMIVPLKSGSGMRAKILEGMALGRVVITTSLGLEGISAKDKVQVLVANNAKEFVAAVQWCKDHPDRMIELTKAARKFVVEKYDHQHLASSLKATLTDYLKDKKQTAGEKYSTFTG